MAVLPEVDKTRHVTIRYHLYDDVGGTAEAQFAEGDDNMLVETMIVDYHKIVTAVDKWANGKPAVSARCLQYEMDTGLFHPKPGGAILLSGFQTMYLKLFLKSEK